MPDPMPIDRIAAEGVTLNVGGRDWTFSALTFRDLAAITAELRSIAIRAYLTAVDAEDAFGLNRQIELSTLAYGMRVQPDDLSDPMSCFYAVRASLRHKHPTVTDAEVEAVMRNEEFNALFAPQLAADGASRVYGDTAIAIIGLLTFGPVRRAGGVKKNAAGESG